MTYHAVGNASAVQVVSGAATRFADPGSSFGTVRYVHRAVMRGLVPGTRYTYVVSDTTFGGSSDPLEFRARPAELDWAPTYAVFGDFGE